ncbi:MAG TPA: hydroxyisourate hydrolase [Burkholderiaceae bacterium]|nr:hydroxyisourate hydrolase [Burkholderiaceae bacterium]
MNGLTSHVLDLALGQPAGGLLVRLEAVTGNSWRLLASAITDGDGRTGDLLAGAALAEGVYRLLFDTGAYFSTAGRESFYPHVEVTFRVTISGQHHHIPLLLSPFGYSTYRGS